MSIRVTRGEDPQQITVGRPGVLVGAHALAAVAAHVHRQVTFSSLLMSSFLLPLSTFQCLVSTFQFSLFFHLDYRAHLGSRAQFGFYELFFFFRDSGFVGDEKDGELV
jgi:hypothetical protein